MTLEKALESDFGAICGLYQAVVKAMESSGLDQWTWGVYPAEDIVRDDIEKEQLYVAREDGRVAAVVCINCEQDDEYAAINWHYGVKPGLFHRLAISPDAQGRGYGRAVLGEVCRILREMGCDSLRCDTYSLNAAALRCYDGFGMRRAGLFRFPWKTAPFVPFEKMITDDCPLLPVRMTPAFRSGDKTPWGGERLHDLYGKDADKQTGESLECSCIPGLESRDATGAMLPELIARHGARLVGQYAGKEFPLLLKLLDAKDTLSVQVHPDDAYAAENEGKFGKTEAWLILDTEPGSELVYGVNPGVTMDELREACRQGSAVEPLLRRVRVRPGDVCYIPAGCVHAIGSGVLLYEIQQSSDVTYRFYDWNRRDAQGRTRELHLDKALAVTDLSVQPAVLRAFDAPYTRVLDEAYFKLDAYCVSGEAKLAPFGDFAILTALTDGLSLCWKGASMALAKGDTLLLPASAPEMTLEGEGRAAVSMP